MSAFAASIVGELKCGAHPLLATGIGVDDMFVLAGALDRAPRHLNLEDRIGYMMKTAGTSITLTSVTGL